MSKIFISWVGLRGAVPIVFATYPLMAGLKKSNIIFNLVFFISVTSVLQGTSLHYVAKLSHVVLALKVRRRDIGLKRLDRIKGEMQEHWLR